MSNIPPARRFPKRLSQQELKDKTTDYMNENGYDNHYKAMYYKETADQVVGLNDHKFFTLQPILYHKDLENEAWNKTYELVIKYLEENECELTIDTIKKEFGDRPKVDSTLSDTDEYFEELFGISKELKDMNFKKRLKQWKKDTKGSELPKE